MSYPLELAVDMIDRLNSVHAGDRGALVSGANMLQTPIQSQNSSGTGSRTGCRIVLGHVMEAYVQWQSRLGSER